MRGEGTGRTRRAVSGLMRRSPDRRSPEELVAGASGSVERGVVQLPEAISRRGRDEVGGEQRNRPGRGRVGRRHRGNVAPDRLQRTAGTETASR